MDKLLTTSEAAKILRIARMTLVHKLRQGEIKGIRIGPRNDWRISPEDLQTYLNTNMEYKIAETPLPQY